MSLAVLLMLGIFAYAMSSPVSDATLRHIVPTSVYPTALAVNDGRDSSLQIVGAPVGGILYGILPGLAMIASAIGSTLNALFYLGIKADLSPVPVPSETNPEPTPNKNGKRGIANNVREHFREAGAGVVLILRLPMIRVLAIGSLLLNVGFSGIFQTIVFDWNNASRSPLVIGLLSTALAVGCILGALVAGKLIRKYRTGTLLIAAFIGVASALSLLAFFHEPWQACALLAITELALPLANAAGLGFMVTATPPEIQGRVISAQTFLGLAATPLALVYAGFSFDHFGSKTTLLVMSIPLVAAMIYVGFNKPLRSIPTSDKWDDYLKEHAEVP